ncbi:MAG: cell division protein FtsA [Clostridiales bacterium]|nr:cell division protein FtsA [Clostridiales bacterium]
MAKEELYFSLDIGTRSVVGLVGTFIGEEFEIIDFQVEEHKKRAMYDGQVHDINLVTDTVKNIKESLENRLETKFEKVSVAAAGRSLKTCKVEVTRQIEPLTHIDKDMIGSLEIEAVQKAQREIKSGNSIDEEEFYCVGYAVTNYYLNGTIIGSLEGHRGKTMGVEVIATFLPKTVIDSLNVVIRQSGLSILNMTLEPIAAMDVAIHDNFKLLNIALVDVGAGTSDIAITKDGTIFAFAMVPTAGDEITEKIAEAFLLDFDTAEKVKLSLSKKSTIKFKDIMGVKHQVKPEEIIDTIEPSIKHLATQICEKIIEYNGKSPSAVFLIGGGSCTPKLSEYIAEILGLQSERVGVRKTDIIKNVIFNRKKLPGPEFITPIGIGVSAKRTKRNDFINVMVNDKPVKLLNTSRLTVADVLIFIGFNPRLLIGYVGKELHFTVNGKNQIIKGRKGEPASIFINGIQGNIKSQVSNGDIITVKKQDVEEVPDVFIRDALGDMLRKTVFINGREYDLKTEITVNGQIVADDYKIKNGDNIIVKHASTIEDILNELRIPKDSFSISINGRLCSINEKIDNGDRIEMKVK